MPITLGSHFIGDNHMASIVQRANGKWLAQVRRKQKGVSKHFVKREDAEKWAAGMEFSVDTGALKIEAHTRKPTLIACLERYLKDVTCKKRSCDKELYRIRRIEREDFAKLPINRITPTHIADYRDKRLKTVGDQVVLHDLNLLGNLFKIAINEWRYKIENPVIKGIKPKQPPSRKRRLNSAEKTKFFDALNKYVGVEEFK